jgi:hypothetical protein
MGFKASFLCTLSTSRILSKAQVHVGLSILQQKFIMDGLASSISIRCSQFVSLHPGYHGTVILKCRIVPGIVENESCIAGIDYRSQILLQ